MSAFETACREWFRKVISENTSDEDSTHSLVRLVHRFAASVNVDEMWGVISRVTGEL